MTTFPRYAIYYVAAAGSDLDRFGAQLLGYDALSGTDLPFPDEVLKTVPDWRELTRDPRKYGFHATLKAPLPLASGKTEAGLLAACANFALTPRQCDHLDRWGYPYVMEDFRFHMTLTGRLDAARRPPVLAMLRDRFAALGLAILAIDQLALCRQDDADSRFRIIDQFVLASR